MMYLPALIWRHLAVPSLTSDLFFIIDELDKSYNRSVRLAQSILDLKQHSENPLQFQAELERYMQISTFGDFIFKNTFLFFRYYTWNRFICVFLEPSASVTLSTPCWRDTCSASMAPTSWSACSSCEASCSWPSCPPRAYTSSTSTSPPFYMTNSAASCAPASSVTSPGCLS